MKHWSVIDVYKLEPSDGVTRPYRLIETYMTREGPRTRVCSGTFITFDDADSAKRDLEVGALSETPHAA